MFKLTLLCAAAGFSSATITNVQGVFDDNKHPGNSRGGVLLCAQHSVAVPASTSNTITYEYPANEIKITGTIANVHATDYTWHTAATDVATAKAATSLSTSVCTHTVSSNVGSITCHSVAVTTSNHYSCLKLLKAYAIQNIITHANIKVKQSITDITFVPSTTPMKVFTNPFTLHTLTAPAADGVVGGAEGTLKISFTPHAAITTSNKVTIAAPGYTFVNGSQCGFGALAKSTATTADSVDFISFTPAAASGATATFVECTKFKASSKIAAPVFSVWVGTADATTAIQGEFVAGKAVQTKAPTAKPTAFSAASQVSYNAVFIGALVAASLFLI